MAVSHLLIAILVRFVGTGPSAQSHSLAAWVSVACVYAFTAAYGMSYGPIGWILPSEVFPLSSRSKGVALSTASNWSNNCTCPMLFLPLRSLVPFAPLSPLLYSHSPG